MTLPTESSENLKPCPFCGAVPTIFDDKRTGVLIECETDNCPANGGGMMNASRSEMIAIWNRRVEE
jgi:hypothetical protein